MKVVIDEDGIKLINETEVYTDEGVEVVEVIMKETSREEYEKKCPFIIKPRYKIKYPIEYPEIKEGNEARDHMFVNYDLLKDCEFVSEIPHLRYKNIRFQRGILVGYVYRVRTVQNEDITRHVISLASGSGIVRVTYFGKNLDNIEGYVVRVPVRFSKYNDRISVIATEHPVIVAPFEYEYHNLYVNKIMDLCKSESENKARNIDEDESVEEELAES